MPPIGFQERGLSPPTPYLRGPITPDRASGPAPAKKTQQSQLAAGAPKRRNDLRHTVTLGHADLGVPKEALDHVKRHTLVHQEAGGRMAQIMQSNVSQARTPPDAVPWTEQTGELRWEDVGARRIAQRRPQQCDGRSIESHRAGLTPLH
jgi:hypothetical protein